MPNTVPNHAPNVPNQPQPRIQPIQTPAQFEHFKGGIEALLSCYRRILLDDFCDSNLSPVESDSKSDAERLRQLTAHTRSCLPWLWIITDDANRVLAIAALGQIIPGRHAFLHGVSHPDCPRAMISRLAERVLHTGFDSLRLMKIKAEFEADNRGALGFCRRMGFTREAHFKRDNRVGGLLKDVVVHSLFADHFYERLNPSQKTTLAEAMPEAQR